MIPEKKAIVELLKTFEQTDYKRGGVSIAPERYEVIADEICRRYNFNMDLYHIGTVEPDYTKYNEETIAFIIGAIKKYSNNSDVCLSLIEYLQKQINIDKTK